FWPGFAHPIGGVAAIEQPDEGGKAEEESRPEPERRKGERGDGAGENCCQGASRAGKTGHEIRGRLDRASCAHGLVASLRGYRAHSAFAFAGGASSREVCSLCTRSLVIRLGSALNTSELSAPRVLAQPTP